jgi:hypothetical protein
MVVFSVFSLVLIRRSSFRCWNLRIVFRREIFMARWLGSSSCETQRRCLDTAIRVAGVFEFGAAARFIGL